MAQEGQLLQQRGGFTKFCTRTTVQVDYTRGISMVHHGRIGTCIRRLQYPTNSIVIVSHTPPFSMCSSPVLSQYLH